jgi:hypothetical protein
MGYCKHSWEVFKLVQQNDLKFFNYLTIDSPAVEGFSVSVWITYVLSARVLPLLVMEDMNIGVMEARAFMEWTERIGQVMP